MKTFNLLFLILFLLTSCEKEPIYKYHIKGTVLDEITQQPIANMELNFDAIGPVGFFGTRKVAGSATSDAQGNFECKLKVFEGATQVDPRVFTFTNDNYETFNSPLTIPINELKNYRNTPYKIYLLPTATLLIHFKNVNPFSANDYFYISAVDPLNSNFSPTLGALPFGKNAAANSGKSLYVLGAELHLSAVIGETRKPL